MYLKPVRTYCESDGTQFTQQAPFLLLLQLKDRPCGAENLFAVVRKVALRQSGQFMTGYANLGGKWVAVSGSYGNDGLPMTVEKLPKGAVAVPAELCEAWNTGGGHDSAGTEAKAMREWAARTFMGGKMKIFELYWSPTGEKIATVQARTAKAAIRKAPLPYCKYPGEIYAVEVA